MQYKIRLFSLIYLLLLYHVSFFPSSEVNILSDKLILLEKEDLDYIKEILNKNHEDLKKINFENDEILFKKIEIIFNIITAKLDIQRYLIDNKALWQIEKNQYLSFKINTTDEDFFELFDKISQDYCSEKKTIEKDYIESKIIEFKIKKYIDQEPILDQTRAQDILKKNNINRKSHSISYLNEILSQEKMKELNLDSVLEEVEDNELKKILLDIYYYFIPELYLLLKNKVISINNLQNDLSNICNFFLFDQYNLIDQYNLKNGYNDMINQFKNEVICLHLYNNILIKFFDLGIFAMPLGDQSVNNLLGFLDCQKIFKHDKREQYIKAFQGVWNKFLDLYKKNALSQHDNEFIFFNKEEQEKFFKNYLQGRDYTDDYISQKCIEYIKNNNGYSILFQLDKKSFLYALSIFKEKDDIFMLVYNIIIESIKESSSDNYENQLNFLQDNIDKFVLLDIKNSIANKFLLRNVENMNLLEIVNIILEFSFKNKIKNVDAVDYKKLSDSYRMEYQILYLWNLRSSNDFFNEDYFNHILSNVPLGKQVFNNNEYGIFFNNLDKVYSIELLKFYKWNIKNQFLLDLFNHDLKEKFINYYRYFKIDAEEIENIINTVELKDQEKNDFLNKIITCILPCDTIDNKEKLKIIFLNDDRSIINAHINRLKLIDEEILILQALYINKLKYLKNDNSKASELTELDEKYSVLNKKSLLYYYCDKFDFITDNIKDIIFEGVKNIKKDQECDKKSLYNYIWDNIMKHKDGEKYKQSYSEGAIIAQQNAVNNNENREENVILDGNYKKVHENDRIIAKQKKIIECLINNMINLFFDMPEEIKLKVFINDFYSILSEKPFNRKYFQYFAVFHQEEQKEEQKEEQNKQINDFLIAIDEFYDLNDFKNFVLLLLSYIKENDIVNVIDYLIGKKKYHSLLDDILKEDVFITIDSLLLYYPLESLKKYINDFAKIDVLWECFVKKINNKETLQKNAQTIFYILLDKKIEQDKLNKNESENFVLILLSYIKIKENNILDVIDYLIRKERYSLLEAIFKKDILTIDALLLYYPLETLKRYINKFAKIDVLWQYFVKKINNKETLQKNAQTIFYILLDKKIEQDKLNKNESENFVLILLSYIKENNIVHVIDYLIRKERYSLLEAIFKKDILTIDSFLSNYPLRRFQNYICDFAEMDFLWNYLVEKINNKETLHKNAQTIFCILLDRKIKKKELNKNESENFVLILLSYIKENNIVHVIDYLIEEERYSLLEAIFKVAIFKKDIVTIDSFLLHYPLRRFQNYICDFAEIDFLWNYLVEKINNNETLHENAQTIFCILLNRKIEKKELNKNESENFVLLLSSYIKNNNIVDVIDYLIIKERYSFLEAIFTEDDSIIDSFLLNYPLESFKKYINDFAKIDFLWKYLVKKINNNEKLDKNTQGIFYILLDKKIEQHELNKNEEKKIILMSLKILYCFYYLI